jgi:hypothetical protein
VIPVSLTNLFYNKYSLLKTRLLYNSELLYNNSLFRDGFYKYHKIDYSSAFGTDISYWDTVSNHIHEAVMSNNEIPFFHNQYVVDHLSSTDPALGYALLNYIRKSPSGNHLLNLSQTPPWGSPFLLKKFPTHSPTTLSHIANICALESCLNSPISTIHQVLDFGGGYGGLARCFLSSNNTVNITIFDSPVMLEVQKLYLHATTSDYSRVRFESSLDSLQDSMFDIFNATFSLSETPLEIRNKVIDYALGHCRNIFIVFQASFGQYSNQQYFTQLESQLLDNYWKPTIHRYSPYATRSDVYVLYASSSVS